MRKKDKKYIVYGGHVISRKDSDKHYVSPRQVARLYGVDKDECVWAMAYNGLRVDDFIPLRPQSDGVYNLEAALERAFKDK